MILEFFLKLEPEVLSFPMCVCVCVCVWACAHMLFESFNHWMGRKNKIENSQIFTFDVQYIANNIGG